MTSTAHDVSVSRCRGDGDIGGITEVANGLEWCAVSSGCRQGKKLARADIHVVRNNDVARAVGECVRARRPLRSCRSCRCGNKSAEEVFEFYGGDQVARTCRHLTVAHVHVSHGASDTKGALTCARASAKGEIARREKRHEDK